MRVLQYQTLVIFDLTAYLGIFIFTCHHEGVGLVLYFFLYFLSLAKCQSQYFLGSIENLRLVQIYCSPYCCGLFDLENLYPFDLMEHSACQENLALP